eukprot:CAMPEP_0197893298 /NCGR_PEP_ID=MMETSP1439-20131203/32683_1 /TAXON_ID=66791 /ORGANISM="Gonyaulax spinifera, Strain CCMP409" /LENGTH=328 /DNA_ID=CAMNT_0043513561 /DNA_START=101 /DNA_END=1085 /DNA_ORIENTATION=-
MKALLLPLLLLGAVADEMCCPQHTHTDPEFWEAIYATNTWSILHQYERGDVDIEITNENGLTPLFYYIQAGDPDMMHLMFNLGASVDAVDPKTGYTMVFDAVMRGYITIVYLLLERGASPNVNDTAGLTPIWYASQRGQYDMVKLLLEYNASTTARDYRNYSPLSLAAIKNRMELATLLLENGANPAVLREEVPNYQGKLSIISVCHKYPPGWPETELPAWYPELPLADDPRGVGYPWPTGKCNEWQPGFVITLQAILKSHHFFDMIRLIEVYGGYAFTAEPWSTSAQAWRAPARRASDPSRGARAPRAGPACRARACVLCHLEGPSE